MDRPVAAAARLGDAGHALAGDGSPDQSLRAACEAQGEATESGVRPFLDPLDQGYGRPAHGGALRRRTSRRRDHLHELHLGACGRHRQLREPTAMRPTSSGGASPRSSSHEIGDATAPHGRREPARFRSLP